MSRYSAVRADLGSILREQAATRGDSTFVISAQDKSVLTYSEFDDYVNSIANGLRRLGVRPGDYVNVLMRNGIEFLAASYAIKKAGAIEVAINSEARGAALARMVNLSQASVLITEDSLCDALERLQAPLPFVATVVVAGDPSRLSWTSGRRILAFAELADHHSADPGTAIDDKLPATVIFTSGTTGPSKGCVLPHRALVRAAEVVRDAMNYTAVDRVYTGFPLFHMRAAYLDVLAPMLEGGSVVIAPRFSASLFWQHMHEFDVTAFSLIGTAMQILWKQKPSDLDRGHKVRRTWGGPLPIDPAEFYCRFGVEVLPADGVFGMSETGMLNMSSLDTERSGKVRPIYEVRIADQEGDPVPPGTPGEILVRPREPAVMFLGYLNMPEATVSACTDMWFHTGDLGRADEAGKLSFIGRQRDMIRRSGNNISTWEIEEVVDSHPDVIESAAVGVPSAMGEEEVLVCIVRRPGAHLDLADLVDYCRGRMAGYMLPQHLMRLDELPKTQTGKVAKVELRQRFLEDTLTADSARSSEGAAG